MILIGSGIVLIITGVNGPVMTIVGIRATAVQPAMRSHKSTETSSVRSIRPNIGTPVGIYLLRDPFALGWQSSTAVVGAGVKNLDHCFI